MAGLYDPEGGTRQPQLRGRAVAHEAAHPGVGNGGGPDGGDGGDELGFRLRLEMKGVD